MRILKYHPPPGRLLAIACLCVALLLGGTNLAQAGPLSAANVHVLDDGVAVPAAMLTFVPGGSAGAWSLTILGSSADFSFVALLTRSNQTWTTINGNITVNAFNLIETSGGTHTFRLEFSDNNFKMPVGSQANLMSSGSITFTDTTTKDKATFQSWADPNNGLFTLVNTS